MVVIPWWLVAELNSIPGQLDVTIPEVEFVIPKHIGEIVLLADRCFLAGAHNPIHKLLFDKLQAQFQVAL